MQWLNFLFCHLDAVFCHQLVGSNQQRAFSRKAEKEGEERNKLGVKMLMILCELTTCGDFVNEECQK